jgi:nucleoid-associated protein YgaU
MGTGDRAAVAAGSLVLVIYGTLLAILVGVYAYFALFDLVLPGVRVGETRLSGLNVEQAAQKLDQTWGQSSKVVITDGKRTWSAVPAAVGFDLNGHATAEQALRLGRGESGWPDPLALISGGEQRAYPVVNFHIEIARQALQTAAAQMNTAPVEAVVHYQNGRWQAIPGKNGSALDIEATLRDWQARPAELLRVGLLPLTMQPTAPVVMDASGEVARLNSLMSSPLKVRAYDAITDESIAIDVSSETLAGMVRVVPGENGVSLQIDAQAFSDSLSKLNLGGDRKLGRLPDLSDLTERWQNGETLTVPVEHSPTTYTVQAGDNLVSIAFKVGIVWWKIRDANPGINPDSLSAGQSLVIPSKDANLPLPVVEGKRVVISISQQRLWTYENGRQRTESIISTGIDRSPTMPGVFQIQSHDVNAYASIWNLYMPHFLGIYEAAPGFMNGIHGLPMLSSGVRLWANVLGQPASYGCIILKLDEAEDLYNWAENGVVVEIKP